MEAEIETEINSSITLLIVKLPYYETVRCFFHKFIGHEKLSNSDI